MNLEEGRRRSFINSKPNTNNNTMAFRLTYTSLFSLLITLYCKDYVTECLLKWLTICHGKLLISTFICETLTCIPRIPGKMTMNEKKMIKKAKMNPISSTSAVTAVLFGG